MPGLRHCFAQLIMDVLQNLMKADAYTIAVQLWVAAKNTCTLKSDPVTTTYSDMYAAFSKDFNDMEVMKDAFGLVFDAVDLGLTIESI